MFDSDQEIMERVQRLAVALTSQGRRMAAAESCTGGLLASACTSLPGSSAWFEGAVVAYANAVKTGVLHVPHTILEQHGAVSLETVQAMALGVCGLLNVSVGVSVSGVAGPGGGTLEKPVGTVCIGLALDGAAGSEIFHFYGGRASVRRQSMLMALDMLLVRLHAEQNRKRGG